MIHRQLPAHSPLPAPGAWWFGDGSDPAATLEQVLKQEFAADGVLLCGSATHALTIALRWAAAARTDLPVLLPAYTCFEVATAAAGARVPLRLYDLDPDTFQPDWDSVRHHARNGAAALVVAPNFGLPADMETARSIARSAGACLIEDAAQSHGGSLDGEPLGSHGDLSVLSFGRGKGWTGAGGGALLSRGPGTDLHRAVPLTARTAADTLRTLAVATAQWILGRPALYGLPASLPFLRLGETVLHEPTPPAAMTALSCRLALTTAPAARVEAIRRQENAEAYARALAKEPGSVLTVARTDRGQGGYLRFPIRVPGGWQARPPEAEALGIGPGYPALLSELPLLAPWLRERPHALDGADRIRREIVTLPTHSLVGEDERERALEVVRGWSGRPVGAVPAGA